MLARPVQIAYAVDDIREAAQAWGDRGAGPFFVRDHIALVEVHVDGSPGAFDHSAAYGQWGDVMLELITIHEPGGTPEGLHHLAFFVDDLEAASAELADHGWAETLRATTPGGSTFVHHDAVADLGHVVELYEQTASMARLYDAVRAASQGWTGEGLIREL